MSLARVVEVWIGDDPAGWTEAGFTVEDDRCVIGDVRVRLGGDRPSLHRWTVQHPDLDPGETDVDGLDTALVEDSLPVGPAIHPNGAIGFDHVVVASPDLDRTTTAFTAIGVECRRTRDTTAGGSPMQQRFFRMGTIIELIGPPEPDGDGPARFWGLALVSEDLDRTAELLGHRLGEVKDAVQPGRRIATLRTRDLGIGVPIAFMTPHRG